PRRLRFLVAPTRRPPRPSLSPYTTLFRSLDLSHVADRATAMLRQSLDAFARLDVSEAMRVVKQDEAVDDEFRAIMRQLITFMMEDPRTITRSLEILFIAKAVGRIGDHAKNMAENVVYMVKGRDVRHTRIEDVERELLE